METQPNFNLRHYALTYRLFYLAFGVSIAPFVIEALVHYNGAPDRFGGDFYYAPFWIGWGLIALLACAIAIAIDTIRSQGMCVSLCGVWYLGRILTNLIDRDDGERFLQAGQWAAWLLIVAVLSYHLAWTRPRVTHLYVYHQRRLAAYKQAKRELDRQEAAAREAQPESERGD